MRHIAVVTPCFSHIRSPYYGLLQATGDAAILLVTDLQNPPSLTKEFATHWLAGENVVVGVKPSTEESSCMFAIGRTYHRIVTKITDITLIQNFTRFGLYDRQVLDVHRRINHPHPYFRGLISDMGWRLSRLRDKSQYAP